MHYSAQNSQPAAPEIAALKGPLETILQGLGLALIELNVFRRNGRKGSPGTAQVRLVVYKNGAMGTDDCARAHRAILPRLELAFPEADFSVEVSTPGIDRLIKDGVEAACYRGRGLRCYRTDISDWTAGILEAADETGITLKRKEGTMRLKYEIIAKAKLDSQSPVESQSLADTLEEE